MNPEELNLTDFWEDTSPNKHRKFKVRPGVNELKLVIPERAILMSSNPRDDKRLAQIAGAGIGPKNILITFSFPITRTNSCIMQYMAISTNRMIWMAQKCGQMISDSNF